jgi:RHS repeat-associated protein
MMREAMRDDRMGRRLRFGATLLLVSALLAPMARADEAAAPLDAAVMAALGIARPVRPEAGPWSWTTGNYAYDASGNITAIGLQSFAYDTRGRLVDATLVRPDQPGSEHETFAYDAFGNMTSRTGASAYSVVTPASLATNHLVGATYDGAGNVTLLTPPGQAFQYEYTYDALGSLNQARAANVAGETRQFSIYTADDERIWTYDLGVNTSHWKIRDLGGRVLRDYVVTGDTWQLSRDYVYRGEQLLSAVTPAETLSFSLDHLGTPRVITRADRTLAGFHQYLPYGEEWTNGTGVQEGEPKKFSSHERDRDPSGAGTTELDYMHARFYSGRVGRFLSVDPNLDTRAAMANPQAWNGYSYVLNNPLLHRDPTGRCNDSIVCINWGKVEDTVTVSASAPSQITIQDLTAIDLAQAMEATAKAASPGLDEFSYTFQTGQLIFGEPDMFRGVAVTATEVSGIFGVAPPVRIPLHVCGERAEHFGKWSFSGFLSHTERHLNANAGANRSCAAAESRTDRHCAAREYQWSP